MIRIPAALAAAIPDLAERVGAHMAKLATHHLTVGLPAPTEDPLVERIARAGGMAHVEIVPDEAPAAPSRRMVPKLLIVERLTGAGLLRAARAALRMGAPDADLTDAELALRERWEAASEIAADDAEVRQFLTLIGADPDAILA